MNETLQSNTGPAGVPEEIRDAVRLIAAAMRRAKERKEAAR